MQANIDNMGELIEKLEKNLGYRFKNKDIILLALTHSSYANENRKAGLGSNERIEFLGDAVLNVVISDYLYRRTPCMPEGEMTKVRANIVCESSLVKCASDLDLGSYVLIGRGEEQSDGRRRPSLLCDLFESVIGAIYLDGGIEEASGFILNKMDLIIQESISGKRSLDYKTRLQEALQSKGECDIHYEIVEEKGPDHDKFYVSQVKCAGEILSQGMGKTKKQAEQNAAKNALKAKGLL